ncbi:MAG: methylthioribulose 1-phosphate dehydratase [Acidobacteriota bacterium]
MSIPVTLERRLEGDTAPVRQGLCEVVRELGAQGWCQGTGGNFSVTLSREPLRLLLTRSGANKRHLAADDLMIVGPGGKPADGETRKPSAEAELHTRIVSLTGAGSVLHVHSLSNTLLGEHFADRGGFTLRGYEMLKGLEGITTHEAEVFVPVLRNRQDMAPLCEEIGHIIGGNDERPGLHGFLLAGHGLYTWGDSLAQAHRHVEIFEFLFDCAARRTQFKPFEG